MELRSVTAIANALNSAGIRYLVVGGLAVNVHGYERFTHDIDLVINLDPDNIRRALHSLMEIGYAPSIPISPEEFSNPENRAHWHDEKGMLVLQLWSDAHRRTPIDVFIQEPFDFDTEWKNAVHSTIFDDVTIPILGYESLIRMKRDAGRDKDLLDISSLRKLDPYRK